MESVSDIKLIRTDKSPLFSKKCYPRGQSPPRVATYSVIDGHSASYILGYKIERASCAAHIYALGSACAGVQMIAFQMRAFTRTLRRHLLLLPPAGSTAGGHPLPGASYDSDSVWAKKEYIY